MKGEMAMQPESGIKGAPEPSRAILIEALVRLLTLASQGPSLNGILLQPLGATECFNYWWMDERGAHAVEIRSTRSMFSKPQVETIVAQMEADHPGADCTLVLVGTVHPRLEKTQLIGRTVLEKKPFDLSAMLEEAGQGIAAFRRSAGLPFSPAAEDALVAQILAGQLGVFCTGFRSYAGVAFHELWRQGVPAASPD
jgi:hypothetical protein